MGNGVPHGVVNECNLSSYIAIARMPFKLNDAIANGQGDGGEVDGVAIAHSQGSDVQPCVVRDQLGLHQSLSRRTHLRNF